MNREKQVVASPIEETEGLFEMANLSPKRAGLPFVVWISPKAGAPQDVRVKISQGPKVTPGELTAVAIRPSVHEDLALLKRWIELNEDVIVKYWDGEIEYTEDAIAALKPLR